MPQDGTVAAGSATISQPAPGRMEIRQSSQRAVIDWRGFSIGQGEQVNIQQPSTSAIALNRVTGPDASRIDGRLSANGQVWLVNPNGVVVGPTGRVDVSGLVATTANISNADFMAGRNRFDQPGKAGAKVVNEGQITVAEGGIAALVAPNVRNAGQIDARLGKVALAAGDKFTLDLHGDRLVSIAISEAAAARLENSGQVLADGGSVTLSAAAARDAVSEVVNTGVVQARSVAQRNGTIVLDGGNGRATVAGTLDAAGRGAGETGGMVTVSADKIELTAAARIDASGDSGGGAIFVGGGVQGQDPAIRNASTVGVARGAKIDASATRKGKGGKAVLWSENRTFFDGEIAARGGAEAGDGGFVETSSRDVLQAFGIVDAAAPRGRAGDWLLDPKDVELRAASTANGSFAGGVFTPDNTTNTPAVIDVAQIRTALNAGTSVTINTTSTFAGNGDITVVDAVTRDAGNTAATLTLNAARNINVNAGITRAAGGTGALNLALNATTGSINLASNIDVATNAGSVSLVATAGAVTQSAGSLKASSLRVTAANTSSLTQAGNDVATLAANITGGGQGFSFVDGGALAIGTVSGVNGITAGGNLSLTAGGAITQSRALTIGGTSSISTGAAAVTLTQTNQLTGAVSLSNSGNNNVSLTNGRATVMGASNVGGAFVLSATGAITQTGALTVAGTSSFAAGANTITLGSANQLTGAVSLSNSGANDVTLSNDRATVLGTLTIGRNLSVTANGGLSQTGVASVGGTSSFAAGANTIALTASNQLVGAISLSNSGNNGGTLTNGRATVLGASTVGGNLAVTSNGAITQTGALTVAGTSSFAAGANAITLTQANQLAGAVTLSNSGATDVSLTNTLATTLGATTIGRNLTVNAGGAIGQTGVLTVGGTSSFGAGANAITLAQANLLTGAVSFTNTGANNVTLVNNRATLLGASSIGGDFALTANGAITQNGVLTVAGASSIATSAAAITLTQANQLTGAVSLSNSGANNVSLTNARATVLGTSTLGNNLTVSATGAITQTGALTVGGTSSFAAGANAVTLTQANQLTGAVSVSNSGANNVALANNRATVLGTSTVGGNYALSAAGAVTQTGVLTVAGTTSVDAGANAITLTQANQLTGAVGLANSGPNNVALTNARATLLGAGTIGGNLTVSATGALTQNAALAVGGTSSFAAGANAITLGQANQLAGAVVLTNSGANDATLNNLMATTLGTTTIGRNLILTSGGAIGQTGVLTVGGTSSLSAGANAITLSLANLLTGAVSLSNSGSNNATLNNNRATVLGASTVGGNLALTSNGAITQTGVLSVGGGSSFAAGAAAITLTQANQLAGAISLSNSGNNDVSLTNARATVLGTATLGRNLAVTATGAITQTGALTVAGTSSFNAGANAISLSQANQLTGAVSLSNSGANDATLANNRATLLAASTVGGNLAVTANGAITQNGVLTVAGGSSFATGAAAITLTQANQLAGAVGLSNSGANNVSLTNARATVLGGSTIGGNLTVSATGALSQSDVLMVGGASSFSAGANPIVLTQANQLAGAVSLTTTGANNAALVNARATQLGASTVGGNLSVAATSGDITQTAGTIAVTGNATLAAAAGAVTQTGGTLTAAGLAVTAQNSSALNQATNNVTTLAASVSGGGFQYTDTNAVAVGTVGTVSGLAASGNSAVSATQFQNTGAVDVGGNAFTITADAALIDASIVANGGITIQPRTANRAINLGSGVAGDAALNLGGAELANLSTTGLLTFGLAGGTGTVTFNGAALGGRNVLARGGSIAFSTTGSSFGNLTLTPSTTGSVTVSAALDLSAGGTLTQTTGAQFQNTAAGSINLGAGSLDVTADAALIAGAITANGGISFQPMTLSRNVNAGSGIAGDTALNFSGTELGLLSSTGTLTLGAAAGTGTVTFNGAALGGRTVAARGGSIAFNTAASSFGSLTLTSNGGASTVTQTAALSAGALGIAGTGTVTLNNAGNNIGTLAASGAQSLQVTDANALTVGTVGGLQGVSGGTLQLRTLSGDITLQQPVSASATSGNSLVLAAGGNLVNLAGPGALSTAGTARFLVYGTNPAATSLGGLTAPAKLYNRTFTGTPPANVPGTDSTFLYSFAPTLTVNADMLSREYGLANPALTFAASGFIDGDGAATALSGSLATAATIFSNVGAYAITQGTLASPLGYSLVFTGANLNVTPAPLTVAAADATREYGLANPTFSGSITGFRNGDTAGVVSGLTYGSAATASSNVGAYAITSSGGTATNYTIASRIDGQLTVTPATLTVIAADATREYGLANPSFGGSITGFRNGDTAAVVGGLTYGTTATPGSNVGLYPITSSGGTATNYVIGTRNDGQLSVTPAPLTVIADDKSREVGQPNPVLTASFFGLRNGDTGAVVTGLNLATTATAASPIGSYGITSSGGSAANYTITGRTDGTLTVTAVAPQPPASPPPAPSQPAATPPAPTPATVTPSSTAPTIPIAPLSLAANADMRQMANDRALTTPTGAGFPGGMATPGDAAQRGRMELAAEDPFSMTFALSGGAPGGLGAIAPAAGGEQAGGGTDALGVEFFLSRWWEWRAARDRAETEEQ